MSITQFAFAAAVAAILLAAAAFERSWSLAITPVALALLLLDNLRRGAVRRHPPPPAPLPPLRAPSERFPRG